MVYPRKKHKQLLIIQQLIPILGTKQNYVKNMLKIHMPSFTLEPLNQNPWSYCLRAPLVKQHCSVPQSLDLCGEGKKKPQQY